MNADTTILPVGTTAAEWHAIEQAAQRELQRRTDAAHAAVIALLQHHAREFSTKQRTQIRRRLGQGSRALMARGD